MQTRKGLVMPPSECRWDSHYQCYFRWQIQNTRRGRSRAWAIRV